MSNCFICGKSADKIEGRPIGFVPIEPPFATDRRFVCPDCISKFTEHLDKVSPQDATLLRRASVMETRLPLKIGSRVRKNYVWSSMYGRKGETFDGTIIDKIYVCCDYMYLVKYDCELFNCFSTSVFFSSDRKDLNMEYHDSVHEIRYGV